MVAIRLRLPSYPLTNTEPLQQGSPEYRQNCFSGAGPRVYAEFMDQSRHYLASLIEISDALIWSIDRLDAFTNALQLVRRATGAAMAPAYLLNAKGDRNELVAKAEETAALGADSRSLSPLTSLRPLWLRPNNEPVAIQDHLDAWITMPEQFRTAFGPYGLIVPVHAEGRYLGVVLLKFDRPTAVNADTSLYLRMVGRLLGRVWYRWYSAEREHELGILEERRHLSEELHVGLSQQVAALGLNLQALEQDIDHAPERARQDIDRVVELVEGLRRDLRSQMVGLRQDEALAPQGFVQTVRAHVENAVRRYDLPIDLDCQPEADQAPLSVATQMVRVLQESLANSGLHSNCTAITVRVRVVGAIMRLEVADDGIGFDPRSAQGDHFGLRIMAERIGQIGGTVTLQRNDLGGTTVVAEAPMPHPDWGSTAVSAHSVRLTS